MAKVEWTKAQRDRMILDASPMVQKMAERFRVHLGLDPKDLYQDGMLVLARIAPDYDPEISETFEQFAFPHVFGTFRNKTKRNAIQKLRDLALEQYLRPLAQHMMLGDMFNETQKTRDTITLVYTNAVRASVILAGRMEKPMTAEQVLTRDGLLQRLQTTIESVLSEVDDPKVRQLFERTKFGGEEIKAVAEELGVDDPYNTIYRIMGILGDELGGVALELGLSKRKKPRT